MSLILSDDDYSLGNFSLSPCSLPSETAPPEFLPFNETKVCTITSPSTLIISKGYEEIKDEEIKDEKDRDAHLVENKNR